MLRPPIMPCTLDFIASSARRPASFTAEVMRSSSSSMSEAVLPMTVGSILSFLLAVHAGDYDSAASGGLDDGLGELTLHLGLHLLGLAHHVFHLCEVG